MTSEAIDGYYQLRAAQHYFDKLPNQLDEQQRQWLVDAVSRQQRLEKQVLGSTESARVVVTDAMLKQAVAEVESQYPDADAFLDDLARYDLTLSQLSDLLERQLRVDLVLERQAAAVPAVTREEARVYYDQHPAKFRQPERRQTWHLLITVNDEYAENQRPQAMARLEAIRAECAGKLELFKKRAKRYSECPSALSAGELGWIPAGQLFAPIDRALFQLAEGEVSPVVETEVGLHLVYCHAIQAEQLLPFEEVAEKLLGKLNEFKQQQAQQRWLRSLA